MKKTQTCTFDECGVCEHRCDWVLRDNFRQKNYTEKISHLTSVVETPSVQVLAHRSNVYARLSASRWKSTRDMTHRRRARASVYSTRIARGSRIRGAKCAIRPVCKTVTVTTTPKGAHHHEEWRRCVIDSSITATSWCHTINRKF